MKTGPLSNRPEYHRNSPALQPSGGPWTRPPSPAVRFSGPSTITPRPFAESENDKANSFIRQSQPFLAGIRPRSCDFSSRIGPGSTVDDRPHASSAAAGNPTRTRFGRNRHSFDRVDPRPAGNQPAPSTMEGGPRAAASSRPRPERPRPEQHSPGRAAILKGSRERIEPAPHEKACHRFAQGICTGDL